MSKPVQSSIQKTESPLSISFFWIFLVATVLSAAALGLFMHFGSDIRSVPGKVIDTYTETDFASRKRSYQQEYVVVKYSVEGKEYTGKTPIPRKGNYSREYVSVFYYSYFPGFPWFYHKTNANIAYCILVLSLSGLMLIWFTLRMAKILKTRKYLADSKKPASAG
jgi:hypothetical protein